MVIITMSTSPASGCYFRIIVLALILAAFAFAISSWQSLSPVMTAILVFAASFVSSWLNRTASPRHDSAAPSQGACRQQNSITENQAPSFDNEEYQGVAKTLYVGNLPYRANEAAIRKLFAAYGMVLSVRLVKDKETGKRRGYGFVEMPEQDAAKAIAALNESEYLQRTLKVREANEKREQGDHVE